MYGGPSPRLQDLYIHPRNGGRGLGTYAAQALNPVGFQTPGIDRIHAAAAV